MIADLPDLAQIGTGTSKKGAGVKLFLRVIMLLLHIALLYMHMYSETCLNRISLGPTIVIRNEQQTVYHKLLAT